MKILELKEKNLGLYKKEPHYNTYEFTVAAQHFKEFGVYTRHPVNTSPSSMWYKFWVEEARRCIYGYNIGRDWIPGYFYWYLNYCPIEKAVKEENAAKESIYTLPESALNYSLFERDKSEYNLEIPTEDEYSSFKGDRVTAFPDFWESDYEFYHYLEEAEQSGEHAEVLKTRGRGYSYKGASMLDRNFYLIPRSKSYAFASEKEYLISDGILTKAWDMMGHIEQHTPWGKRKSKVDTTLHKRASYLKLKQGVMTELGFGSEIIGVTFKNNPDKGRGKRGKLIIWEEFGMFMESLVAWNIMLKSMAQGRITFGLSVAFGCVCAGTKVYTANGDYINIEDLQKNDGIIGFNSTNGHVSIEQITYMQPPTMKECVRIKTINRTLECSIDHPIFTKHSGQKRTGKEYIEEYYCSRLDRRLTTTTRRKIAYSEKKWKEAGTLKKGDIILIAEEIDIWGNNTLDDPYLIGLLIGDGYYGTSERKPTLTRNGCTEIHSVRLSNCDNEINEYIYSKYNSKCEKSYETKDGKLYKETRINGIIPLLRKVGIAGQSKDQKRLPLNYMRLTKNDASLLLAGLFDTDGSIIKGTNKSASKITLAQANYDILVEIKTLLDKFGISAVINYIKPYIGEGRLDVRGYYRLIISQKNSIRQFAKHIPIKVKYKSENLNTILSSFRSDARHIDVFNNIREEKILSVEYIGLNEIYNLTAGNTHTYLANNIITHNTGGSAMEYMMGLEQLFIRGDGYKVHMIPNRFEPEMGYDRTALFIGEHRNHEVATDKDGNSHEDKALAFIEEDRRRHLEKTKNREMHIRYKAEAPIKPSEALTIVGKNPFPVDLLKQQKAYLLTHKESILAGTWIGSIGPNPETGEIEWHLDKDAIPIDHYPHNDIENLNGCVTIWEPPAKNREGKVPDRIYVSGNDNYDHDDSTTDSLGSTFIINRVSRRIVAEYTGRPATASMFYKTNMDLLVMYNSLQNFENNLQGLRNDARKNHMEDMLCDTPDIIKDKIDDKRVLNRIKGTPGTTPIKKYGRELILDWLLSPVEPGSQLLMLNTIRSIPLLEELIYYNPSGNFDRIDALLYTMILMEDMFEHIPAYEETQRNELPKFFKDNPLFSQNQGQGRITRVNNKIMIQQQGIVSPFKKYFE